jgi:hypothetical protein
MKTAALMALLILQPVFSACKKTETTGAKPFPEAHQQEMLNRSFEESKKVTAVTVNGEDITEFFVVREMNAIADQYLKPGQRATPELNARIRKDALNTLITQALAVQLAKKSGLTARPEAIDAVINKIKADKGSETGYKEYLAHNGLAEGEFRKMIEQDRLFELIATREIDAKIMVTDSALRERYKKEKAGMKDAAHRQMTFEAAKGLLEQRIRAEAGQKKMREWKKELRNNARIEIVEQKPQR